MKKRFLSLFLLCIMVCSLILTSCSGETEVVETAASIYTLYMICEEPTTDEAIHDVELALNRLVYNELGFCVKLYMTTAEEYDKMIEDKFAEMAEYTANKNNKDTSEASKTDDSSAESGTASGSGNGETVLTGDEIINMLDAGGEIELKNPRLDIFYVSGYENYINYVADEMLADLTEKLASEAKVINDKVYPTFMTAAKVINKNGKRKTYGVPMNSAIGEYEYLVFDSELLEKYQIDASTMNNLEDLESYLRIIKENESDVVPLANVFDSTEINYLFDNGFAAYINSEDVVVDTYKDSTFLDYMTLVSRYRSLGYLQDANDDSRFAVKFVRGTYEDLEALEHKTGFSYKNVVYSYPVATNENTLQDLFCVSKYCVADQLTAVSRLLAYIESNSAVANLLTYGVEGTHYELNDDNQVIRLNQDYMNKQKYTGNAFLTYTLEGENTDKWELLKQQNLDSGKSSSSGIGFSYYPVDVPDPDDKKIVYTEPDYVDIITKIVSEKYPGLIDGTAGAIDANVLYNNAHDTVLETLTSSITTAYTEAVNTEYRNRITASYAKGTERYAAIEAASYNEALDSFITTSYRRDLRNALKAIIQEELGSDATLTEINDAVTARFTDDYIREQIAKDKTAEEVASAQAKVIANTINAGVTADYTAALASAQYQNDLAAALSSDAYRTEIANATSGDNYDLYQANYTEQIREKLSTYCMTMRADFSTALRSAYDQFVNQYLENVASGDNRSEADYAAALDALSTDKLKNKALAALQDAVKKELGADATEDAIKEAVDNRFTTQYIRSFVEENVSKSELTATYETMVRYTLEKALGIESTVEKPGGETETSEETSGDESSAAEESSVAEESSEESSEENPTDKPSEEEPEEDPELYSFFESIFKNRIEKQYRTYSPLAAS